ncbi:MAG: FAD-dependent oxidoreductase [Pseudomonadota bacterium]
MTRTAVLGSGIVGICCAIALADDGHQVTLIDRSSPAQETSRWNAGVMATSSIVPLNNPSRFGLLPRLIAGRHPGFRLNGSDAGALLPWSLRFLSNSRKSRSEAATAALKQLIGQSRQAHEALCARAGFEALQGNGWLMLYRGSKGAARAVAQSRNLMAREVEAQNLTLAELARLEPNLSPAFTGAVHIVGTAHTDPAALALAYLKVAADVGIGRSEAHIKALSRDVQGWHLDGPADRLGPFDQVVLALGPWTNDILRSVSKRLPLAIERGYLQKFACDRPPARPFLDLDAGYVAAARPGGVQMSSGTHLTRLGSKPNPDMLSRAIPKAKEALRLGAALLPETVVGNRPTLPDGLPVIGALQGPPGLWIATGHQHVGFSTSAGTAILLAALMRQSTCNINPEPFNPRRFGV